MFRSAIAFNAIPADEEQMFIEFLQIQIDRLHARQREVKAAADADEEI